MSARDQILEAADRLFGEVGFDAASTREIAERSGANKALIYYHFKSKEHLFEQVLDRYYDELSRTLVDSMESGGTLRERMTRLIDAYVDFLARNRNFGRIVQREAAGGMHFDRIHAHMVPLVELGTRQIHAEVPATREGALSADQLLVSFYGMVLSYFTYSDLLGQLWKSDPLSKKNLAKRKAHLARMVDIVMDAIGAD